MRCRASDCAGAPCELVASLHRTTDETALIARHSLREPMPQRDGAAHVSPDVELSASGQQPRSVRDCGA